MSRIFATQFHEVMYYSGNS